MTTAHYPTLEAAYLAVARLRNEGYVASVCDDAVATIWGPLAVGGVRVVSSDEPIEGVDRIAGCSFPHRGGYKLTTREIRGDSYLLCGSSVCGICPFRIGCCPSRIG